MSKLKTKIIEVSKDGIAICILGILAHYGAPQALTVFSHSIIGSVSIITAIFLSVKFIVPKFIASKKVSVSQRF